MVFLALIALCAGLLPGRCSAGQRPVERSVQGVVESVDAKANLLTLKLAHPTSSAKTMTVAWRSRTEFQAASGEHAKADMVKPGMSIEVRYRSLLLGANQATHITLH